MSDMPSAYRLIVRTARKQHKCCECLGVILRGEKYNYHSGIWDGGPESYKVCLDCDALREQVVKDCDLFDEERPALTCLGDDLEFDHLDAFRAIQKKAKASRHRSKGWCVMRHLAHLNHRRERSKAAKQESKPWAISRHWDDALLKVDLALADAERINQSFHELLLIWNTAYLLVKQNPTYRDTELDAAVQDAKPIFDRTVPKIRAKEALTADDQLVLGSRVARIVQELGTVPYSRVKAAQTQAAEWMRRSRKEAP